jgi:hypothetical protein
VVVREASLVFSHEFSVTNFEPLCTRSATKTLDA